MCRSTLTDEQIGTLVAEIKSRYPQCCPRCYSDSDFSPTFDVDGAIYHCTRCGHLWSPEE
jgi:hypothetical protein